MGCSGRSKGGSDMAALGTHLEVRRHAGAVHLGPLRGSGARGWQEYAEGEEESGKHCNIGCAMWIGHGERQDHCKAVSRKNTGPLK